MIPAGPAGSMDASLPEPAAGLHRFWFLDSLEGPEPLKRCTPRWFASNPEFDAELDRRFGGLPSAAEAGELDVWTATPRGWLCLLLVLDQLPRNLFRDSADAFRFDDLALQWAERGIKAGWDTSLHPAERVFAYLPLEHAENLAVQTRCVDLFADLAAQVGGELKPLFGSFLDYAEKHRAVIERFGRFPHRNAVLGRQSSADERAFLAESGRGF